MTEQNKPNATQATATSKAKEAAAEAGSNAQQQDLDQQTMANSENEPGAIAGSNDETTTGASQQTNAPKEPATSDEKSLQQQLEEATATAEKNWDVALRTKAELENIKRRAEKDVENARKYGIERMAGELIGVHESMELGLLAAEVEGVDLQKIIEGSELTMKLMETLMEKFNIVQLDPLNEKFNPDHHQAISMQQSTEHESNTVITVVQKGYLLNDRLLRPAMVIVAKN